MSDNWVWSSLVKDSVSLSPSPLPFPPPSHLIHSSPSFDWSTSSSARGERREAVNVSGKSATHTIPAHYHLDFHFHSHVNELWVVICEWWVVNGGWEMGQWEMVSGRWCQTVTNPKHEHQHERKVCRGVPFCTSWVKVTRSEPLPIILSIFSRTYSQFSIINYQLSILNSGFNLSSRYDH
jgi:hypothetical protein